MSLFEELRLPSSELSRGPQGPPGEPFNVDAQGLKANRPAFSVGFPASYLAEDTGEISIKRASEWGPWIPFRGRDGKNAFDAWRELTDQPDATIEDWVEAHRGLQGNKGADGEAGPRGPGPYEEYQNDGGTLTYEEWTEENLRGPTGLTGDDGPKGDRWDQGLPGRDGESFAANAVGDFAGRAEYDLQEPPFVYKDTSVAPPVFYEKLEGEGLWGAGYSVKGDAGEAGPALGAEFSGYDLILSEPDGTEVARKNVRGAAGPGVAVGGQTGHILRKKSSTNYDTEFVEGTSRDFTHTQPSAKAKVRKTSDVLASLPTIEDYGARGKVYLTPITASRDASMAAKVVAPSSLGADSQTKMNYLEVGDGIQIEGGGSPVGGNPRNLITRITAITGSGASLRLALEHNCVEVTNAKCHPDDTLAMQDCMDAEPHFRIPKIPVGSEGWSLGGELYLPGAGNRPPRPTTIECGGYVTRIKRRGALNVGETRQSIDGQASPGTPAPSFITIKNLFYDGNSEEMDFGASDLADISPVNIMSRDSNPLYHAYNINLLDCEFKSACGPVTFYYNVHGGIHRCRAYGKLEKGGYQFIAATTDIEVQNPVVLGSSDDAIGINAYADITAEPTSGGLPGGGRPERINITGGHLEVNDSHVGGACLAVRGAKDITGADIRMIGGGFAQVRINNSGDDIKKWSPENVNVRWRGVRSRLPHYNNLTNAVGDNPNNPALNRPGSHGLEVDVAGGTNLRFEGDVEEPGGHGVYVYQRGNTDVDLYLRMRVRNPGKPRTHTIKNAQIEGYTNGQTVSNYKGYQNPNATTPTDYRDTQCGLYVDQASGVTGKVNLTLDRCRFESARLQNVASSSLVRFGTVIVDGLRVENAHELGAEILASGGTPRADVDQVYLQSANGFPEELSVDRVRARDRRQTKLCRNHLRFQRAPAAFADLGAANVLPNTETTAGQPPLVFESNQYINARSAKEMAIALNTGLVDSAAATANPAGAIAYVSDPALRIRLDTRSLFKAKVLFSFGGSVAASTVLRIQYAATANINVNSTNALWKTLQDSAGNHVVGTLYETVDMPLPAEAIAENLILRAVIVGGDGVASPTIRVCRVRLS